MATSNHVRTTSNQLPSVYTAPVAQQRRTVNRSPSPKYLEGARRAASPRQQIVGTRTNNRVVTSPRRYQAPSQSLRTIPATTRSNRVASGRAQQPTRIVGDGGSPYRRSNHQLKN